VLNYLPIEELDISAVLLCRVLKESFKGCGKTWDSSETAGKHTSGAETGCGKTHLSEGYGLQAVRKRF
jgi:hypothetical protein